jgi:5-carboxymethyl-2-hydroxymuconate isomerase
MEDEYLSLYEQQRTYKTKDGKVVSYTTLVTRKNKFPKGRDVEERKMICKKVRELFIDQVMTLLEKHHALLLKYEIKVDTSTAIKSKETLAKLYRRVNNDDYLLIKSDIIGQ